MTYISQLSIFVAEAFDAPGSERVGSVTSQNMYSDFWFHTRRYLAVAN